MDYLLPDDNAIELMNGEFKKLRLDANARAFALEEREDETNGFAPSASQYISAVLLLLYFVKHMRYNVSYGTEIFNADGGLEQLQRVGGNLRKLNGLH